MGKLLTENDIDSLFTRTPSQRLLTDSDIDSLFAPEPTPIRTISGPKPIAARESTAFADIRRRPPVSRAELEGLARSQQGPGAPRFTADPLAYIKPPEEPERLPEPIAKADVTRVSVARPGLPEPPSMRALTPPEILTARVREREEAEREALNQRYEELKQFAPSYGVGMSAIRGIDKLAAGLPGRAAEAAYETIVDRDVPSVRETFEELDRPLIERGTELAATIGAAGAGIAAQNRILGAVGKALPRTSRAGRALRSFDPRTPIGPGKAAAQSAIEGIPYDLAYEAETPGERAANLAAGLAIGGALGPVFRRTSQVEHARVQRGLGRARRRMGQEAPTVTTGPEPEVTLTAPANREAEIRQALPEPPGIAPAGRAEPEVPERAELEVPETLPVTPVAPTPKALRPVRAKRGPGYLDEQVSYGGKVGPEKSDVQVDAIISPVAPAAPPSKTKSLVGRLPEAGPIATGRPRQPGETVEIPNRRQMTNTLSKILGIPFRTGGFGSLPRRVLGFYRRPAETVHSRIAQDMEVKAHEAIHHIHNVVWGSDANGVLDEAPLNPFADELLPLSYNSTLREGLAEWGRRYVTNPSVARTAAPNFTTFWESTLEQQWPEALEMLRSVADDYRVWREAPAQARIRAQRARTQDKAPKLAGLSPWEKLRTHAIDNLLPLRALTREGVSAAGKPLSPTQKLAMDAGMLADLARGSTGQAELFIEQGILDPRTRKVIPGSPSLQSVLTPIADENGRVDPTAYDNFVDYAIARRVEYLYRTRADIGYLGIERADAEETIRALDSPEFAEALERFQQYNSRGLLRWLHAAGVISDDTYTSILANNKIYVPLMREMDDDPQLIGGGKSLLNRRNPIKRIRESGRQILDPFEVTLQRTYEYMRLAAKQRVSNAVFRLSQQPGMGALIEIEPQSVRAIKVGSKELRQAVARSLGVPVNDPAMAEMLLPDELMFFRPSDYLGDNVISIIQAGERKFFRLDPELFRAIEGIDEEQVGTLTRIFAVPARTLRAGATLAPEFAFRNPIRDQIMAAVQSEWGYIPFVDLVQGMASILRKDEYWQAYKAGGGSRSALVGLDRKAIRKAFREHAKVGRPIRNVIKNPLDLLRAFSQFTEEGTRIGETRRAMRQLTTEGVPAGTAAQLAAAAGREVTLDFARHGLEGARLRMMAAFWNAQIQGYDKLARTFKLHPARSTTKALAYVTLPSVLEHMIYRNDPDYWEIPQWQRDLFWITKIGDQWIRIPKPFELGLVFGTIPQRILEWFEREDPEGMKHFVTETLKDQGERLLPVPTWLSPLIDNYGNWSRFLNRPIVPRGLEGVEKERQATTRTSEVAKHLGRVLGYPPAKIDHLFTSYTGGLGRYALEAADIPLSEAAEAARPSRPLREQLPGMRGFVVSPGGSGESEERLYRTLAESEPKQRTLSLLERRGDQELPAYVRKNLADIATAATAGDFTDALAELRQAERLILEHREMTGDEKRAALDRLRQLRTEIARAGNRATRGVRQKVGAGAR